MVLQSTRFYKSYISENLNGRQTGTRSFWKAGKSKQTVQKYHRFVTAPTRVFERDQLCINCGCVVESDFDTKFKTLDAQEGKKDILFADHMTQACHVKRTIEWRWDPKVLDWVPRHHYLGLTIFELKNAKIKRAFSFVVIACDFCLAHVNLHTRNNCWRKLKEHSRRVHSSSWA